MKNENLTRRGFISRASLVGAVAVGSGSFLAACGGGESDSGSSSAPAPAPAAEEPMAAVDCSDVSGLSETDIATRNSLQYVDVTPEAEKRCDNCQLYVEAAEGEDCGGCQIMKGPIAPGGYCISWAAKV